MRGDWCGRRSHWSCRRERFLADGDREVGCRSCDLPRHIVDHALTHVSGGVCQRARAQQRDVHGGAVPPPIAIGGIDPRDPRRQFIDRDAGSPIRDQRRVDVVLEMLRDVIAMMAIGIGLHPRISDHRPEATRALGLRTAPTEGNDHEGRDDENEAHGGECLPRGGPSTGDLGGTLPTCPSSLAAITSPSRVRMSALLFHLPPTRRGKSRLPGTTS